MADNREVQTVAEDATVPECCGRPKIRMRYKKSGKVGTFCAQFVADHAGEFASTTTEEQTPT